MVTIPGGSARPVSPPSIFDMPSSCLPSPKPAPRQSTVEDLVTYLKYFLKDKILSFATFHTDKELHKTHKNIIITRTVDTFVCLFMQSDFSESNLINIVHNKSTLCSPLTFSAFKNGVSVPLGRILSQNNGLSSYSQFLEAVPYLTLPLFLVGHDVGYYGPPFFPVGSNFCASVYVHSCISGDVSQPSASFPSSTAFAIYHAFCDYTL